MKHIKLIAPAYVGGAMRQPHEGVQIVSNEEAEKLLEAGHEDVSDEFAGLDSDPAKSNARAGKPAGKPE